MKEIKTISQIMQDKYVRENYPSTPIYDITKNEEYDGVLNVTDDEILDLPKDVYPVGVRDEDGDRKSMWVEGITHTMTIGGTGCGKTTGELINSVDLLSRTKERPSMLVYDQGGEIVKATILGLKEKGYDIKIINADNPSRSDCYNCLDRLKTMVCRRKKEGKPLSKQDDTESFIEQCSGILQPVESASDPIWEYGARDVVVGLLWDMAEDLYEGYLPEKSFNLFNLISRYYCIKEQVCEHYRSLKSIEHFSRKKENAMSVTKLGVFDNNERTRSSFLGVVETHNSKIARINCYMLTSYSTISIEDFVQKPTVIFIKSGLSDVANFMIGFLVNDIYTYLKEQREKDIWANCPTKKVHAFLDEFANSHVADGETFIKMITESRKYGLRLHLYLQSDVQLISKYNEAIATTIRGNCTEIFMGSQNYDTLKRFSDSLGFKTIYTYESMAEKRSPSLETVKAVPIEKLRLLPRYHFYIAHEGKPVLYSYYKPSYLSTEIKECFNYDDVYPYNEADYEETGFSMEKEKFSMYDRPYQEETVTNQRYDYDTTCNGEERDGLPESDEQVNDMAYFLENDDYSVNAELYSAEYPQTEKQIDVDYLEGLGIVPKGIIIKLRKYSLPLVPKEQLSTILDKEYEMLGGFIGYEIVEEFIRAHSFDSISDWVLYFRESQNKLNEIVEFSEVVKLSYEKAWNIFDGLNKETIEEIKRIVDSN